MIKLYKLMVFYNEKTISVDKYLDFLSSGSNDYSLKLLQKLGIDLTDETTINNSFRMLEDDINEMSSVLIKKV